MKKIRNIAVLASGSGTNAENIARYFNSGTEARVALVISNRAKAGVLRRMEPLGVPCEVIPNAVWDNDPGEVVKCLRDHDIDLVVLAGFMHYVSPVIVEAYSGRILNIHPSLLPKYGGKGMYGHYVHEAVVANHETESGVTVHYVTNEMDKGEILLQEKISVIPSDTAESVEEKIHPVEYRIYPKAIELALRRLDPPAIPDVEEAWAERLKIKNIHTPQPPRSKPVGQESAPAGKPSQDQPSQGNGFLFGGEKPPTYLVWSVLMTVFCCLLPGIVAIFYSSRVSSRYYAGDIEGAKKSSRRAEMWIIIAFSLGITLGPLVSMVNSILTL